MMRKSYDSASKVKVAVEALKEEKTVAALFDVHPHMVAKWKKQLVERIPSIFTKEFDSEWKKKLELKKEAILLRKIGELNIENDFLKESTNSYTERDRQNFHRTVQREDFSATSM